MKLKPYYTNNGYLIIVGDEIKSKYRRNGYYTNLIDYSAKMATENGFKGVMSHIPSTSLQAKCFWGAYKNKTTIKEYNIVGINTNFNI